MKNRRERKRTIRLILTILVLAAPAWASGFEYQIDESLSFIEVVPSSPGDGADPDITAGTFFADVGAVIDAASILSISQPFFLPPFLTDDTEYADIGPSPSPLSSLRTGLSGTLQMERSGDDLGFLPGSQLDAALNPDGPFDPPAFGEDNFGATAVGPFGIPFVDLVPVLGQMAIRDVTASVVGGTITPGFPANQSEFNLELTGGFLDYRFDPDLVDLLGLDPSAANGFITLIDIVNSAPNESSELVLESPDGTLTVPFQVTFPFVLFESDPPAVEPDSQLVLRGVVVAAPVNGPGDFNGDGVVDAADYTVWRDDLVGQVPFSEWSTNFGQDYRAVAPVPEPASLLTVALIGLGASICGVRSHAAYLS
ncbi:MAG: hypothetical protein AAGJ46_01700 [Planctomycetota bacterium]